MIGRATPHTFEITMSDQERDDFVALLYRWKNGEINPGLGPDITARVNNLAAPLYNTFKYGDSAAAE